MSDALTELTTRDAIYRTVRINETRVDLPANDYASERGFVVQMYDDSLREAWFFIGNARCPMPSNVIEAVLAAASGQHAPFDDHSHTPS